MEVIWENAVYARELESHLPRLYDLVFWKRYLDKENTWEQVWAVQHLKNFISLYHKYHSNKPTATFPAINTAILMARLTVKSTELLKWKRKRTANSTNKQAKKNLAEFDFYHIIGQILLIFTLDILIRITCDYTWLHVTAFDFQPTASSKLLSLNF